MKRTFKNILLLLIVIVIGLLGTSIYKKIRANNSLRATTATLPSFVFLTLNDASFSEKDLSDRTDRIIMNYFNPDCEHCQYMSQSYLKNQNSLKHTEIIMVTCADKAATLKFVNDYKLYTVPNIKVLRDTSFQFEKIFGSSVVSSSEELVSSKSIEVD